MNGINKKRSLQVSVRNLSERISSTNQSFRTLKSSFDKIEKLIQDVRSITAKTDLLALNASIEAARAGHSGKGFAVVAHEVARLAEKSQESIQNVDVFISELKENLSSIASSMEAASQVAKELGADSEYSGDSKNNLAA